MTSLMLLQLCGVSIFDQLKIEEALLRADDRNWCILNKRSSPAIVMGISGKEELLLNLPLIQKKPITTLRRFSGGGTVIVDENTLFATFICNSSDISVDCFPEKVHRWAEEIYHPVFQEKSFRLRENDYVFGEHKFGGNAQYLRKNRWLHHTSFLWDYDCERMNYLLLPQKRPDYRQERSHRDFLCCLKDKMDGVETFDSRLICELKKRFNVQYAQEEGIKDILELPHRKATIQLA